jgi:hypothetical protein
VALVGVDFDAVAGLELVEGVVRQLGIVAVALLHVIEDVAVDLVCQALLLQLLDQLDHLGDELGGPGIVVRLADAEQLRVLQEGGGVELGDLLGGLLLGPRRRQHLVLPSVLGVVLEVADVGDVLDQRHVEAEVAQRPHPEVGHQVRTEVADVCVLVDRWAAVVDVDVAGAARHEVLFLATQRVVDPDLAVGACHGQG